jgi:hypothetical protein
VWSRRKEGENSTADGDGGSKDCLLLSDNEEREGGDLSRVRLLVNFHRLNSWLRRFRMD